MIKVRVFSLSSTQIIIQPGKLAAHFETSAKLHSVFLQPSSYPYLAYSFIICSSYKEKRNGSGF